MLKIIVIVCVLLGILAITALESWLRRHIGSKELASSVYTVTMEKYGEFWRAQLVPVAILVVIIGLLIGFTAGPIPGAVFALGAVFAFLYVFFGTRSFSSSVVSSSSLAMDGEIKPSLRSAYRGGAVMGLEIMTIVVVGLGILFFFFNRKNLIANIAYFGLGVSTASLCIRLSGSVMTSASKLAASKTRSVDYTGVFAATGCDFGETFVLSICSAILLAGVGVDASGPTSTFTATDTTRYPMLIAAIGLAACVFSVFTYRALTGKKSHYSVTAGVLVAGIIVYAASAYLSITMLESIAYSFCIGFGILAVIISAEFSKIFSDGSEIFKKNLPKTKDDDVDIPVLNGLAIGMISTVVPTVLVGITISLSFNIASYYGIALAAVGATCVTAASVAVREFASTSSSAAMFTEAADDNAEANVGYYNIFKNLSQKTKTAGKSYSIVSAIMTVAALLTALAYVSDHSSVDILSPLVFAGLIFGIVVTMIIIGLIIKSVLSTGRVMLDETAEDDDEYVSIYSVRGISLIIAIATLLPLVIGTLGGTDVLTGFMCGCNLSGAIFILALSNTGIHFDRTSADALGSVIKYMTIFAIAFIPAFGFFNEFFS